ncbi:MAG TPA: penicillin acylase family protein [Candidatus Angelobacter sp.]|nr:penicillin acylase family protein [Candidatus Angelobacter sp.]
MSQCSKTSPAVPRFVFIRSMRGLAWLLMVTVVFTLALPVALLAEKKDDDANATLQKLPGLLAPVRVVRDTNDIPHVKAANEHDMAFVQGYLHAQDRLFQMDVSRRQASGTLAELVGQAALAQDVQLRTLGLRRAAVRSLPVQSARAMNLLQGYSDGINAWVASHPLPPEYGALELTKFAPWTPTDSLAVVKLIGFGLSFDIDTQGTVELLSFQGAGQAAGFDGAKLFFEDIERSAPFNPASTVPDASVPLSQQLWSKSGVGKNLPGGIRPETLALARDYVAKTKDIPLLRHAREQQLEGASNEFAISGRNTTSGAPLVENDPHLSLGEPSTWYPIHLEAGGLDVMGNGFPGTPGVTLGRNKFVAWGATNDGIDVTDTFQEQVVPDPTSPSGFSTIFKGKLEHVIPVPEVFRFNKVGDGIADDLITVPPGGSIPPATLIVPRRNNGPIISLNTTTGAALSIEWTGYSATHELDAVLIWASSHNIKEFQTGLPFFSVPPQNIAYADVNGNIAYFAVGEMPVREDLQAGTVNGALPVFIRNGQGGNEWLPVIHPQPGQSTAFEILPFAEMPHVINPKAGFFVNANNDPAGVTLGNNPIGRLRPGGGIYYLGYTFDAGFRSGRITQLIRDHLKNGKISFRDVQKIQANVSPLDAEFFTGFVTQAFDNARARAGQSAPLATLANDPAIAEAVGRLRGWDFSMPTGIPEGYDGFDVGGPPFARSGTEIANSVAATLYNTWRGQFISETLGATLAKVGLGAVEASLPDQTYLKALRHLLENFSTAHGVGASGLNFFQVAGVTDAGDRRDIVILQSLKDALTLLASPAFNAAFGGSTNQNDYRWGKLHRVTLAHILGAPFSIPPAGGAFPQPLAGLPGIPVDGGYQTVDAASFTPKANTVNGFTFSSGPSQRFVGEGRDEGIRGVSSLPGGISGVLGSPFYVNLLPQWLANHAYRQLFTEDDLEDHILNVTRFVP